MTTSEDTAVSVTVEVTSLDASTVKLTILTPPAHGTLTGDGPTWTYTPAHDFNGSDVVTVLAEDSIGSAEAIVPITVTPVDDGPIANADSFAGGFNMLLNIPETALLANDVDVDGPTLRITEVAAVEHGVPVLALGNIQFTPEIGFQGVAMFEYTISDGSLTAHATVSITIGVDEAPVAVDDAVTTPEDTTAVIADATLLANDSDPDHQTLRISDVGGASHGLVTHSGTQVTFVPDPDFHGPAQFSYTITDGFKTDVATVVVTVTSVNDVPVAVSDTGETSEDTAVTFTSAALVANDTDRDGDELSVVAVTPTANTHGTVSLAGGIVTYTPAHDFSGGADFEYTVSDGQGGTASAIVEVAVTPVNDDPVVVADTLSTDEDTPLATAAAALAANDTDVDGDALTVTAVAATATTHGTVSLSAGTVTYTPDPDYNGPADFDYTISDDNGGTASGSVQVTVISVNDAPVVAASAGTVSYIENDPAVVVDPDIVLADVDSPALVSATVQIATGCTSPEDVLALASPPGGITATDYVAATCTLTLTGPASLATFQAALRLVTYANASDAPSSTARVVQFTVDDGEAVNHLGSGSRDLSVTPVNDPPVPVADLLSTDEDTPLHVAAATLAGNDTDVDGGALTVTAVAATATTHGGVILAAGTVTYTPDPDYNGPADFEYTVFDGNGGTATGSVQVTVISVNDAPVVVASAGTVAYVENDPAVVVDPGIAIAEVDTATLVRASVQVVTGCANPEDVLAFSSPPGGIATISYEAATCTLTLSGPASIATYEAALRLVTYVNTSDAPSAAARVVRFTVDDGEAVNQLGSADRDLSVTPVDDDPVAVDDTASVAEDADATPIAVLANDTDVDAGPKTVSAVTQPAHGTVAINIDATGVTYAPQANYCNRVVALAAPITPDTFTYTLSPGGRTATVSVTVICVDDAPVAVDDDETVAEDSAANSFFVLANDTDIDGGPRTVASVSTPSHGIASVGDGGLSVLYAPSPGYCNQAPNTPRDTFTYTLTPGGSSATVSVTVPCACGKNKPTDFVVGSN